ncbi:hypothetical protein Dimus_029244, partial [Dionaea muscipula]
LHSRENPRRSIGGRLFSPSSLSSRHLHLHPLPLHGRRSRGEDGVAAAKVDSSDAAAASDRDHERALMNERKSIGLVVGDRLFTSIRPTGSRTSLAIDHARRATATAAVVARVALNTTMMSTVAIHVVGYIARSTASSRKRARRQRSIVRSSSLWIMRSDAEGDGEQRAAAREQQHPQRKHSSGINASAMQWWQQA